MVSPPEYVLAEENVLVQEPLLATEPAPEKTLLLVKFPDRLKINKPLLMTDPVGNVPLASIFPTCKVAPLLMMIPPETDAASSRISEPFPAMMPPVKLSPPLFESIKLAV